MTIRVPAPRRDITPHRLRRELYWLTQDWILLSRSLPTPSGGGGERTSNVRVYGHPAEWASDQCRQIADLFYGWHEMVSTRRGESIPAPITTPSGMRVRSERQVIVAAWRYLEPRLEWMLAERTPLDEMLMPAPWLWEWRWEDEAFRELFDLHRQIRSRTGQNTPTVTLSIPCPNSTCGLRTLQRSPGMKGQDYIVCGSCGYTVKDEHYQFLVKVMLDTLPGGSGRS